MSKLCPVPNPDRPDDCPKATESEHDMDANRRRWHLDRSVSIGHLITTLTIAASIFIWAMKMETRISLLEQSAVRQVEIDRRQDDTQKESVTVMRDQLRDINSKLDRIIEKGR